MNKEHYRIFLSGIDTWKSWRIENPKTWPDLREADLRNMNLGGWDLNKTLLSGADMRSTYIVGADLSSSVFIKTDLSGSYISFVDFSGLNLSYVDLSRCEVSKSSFARCDLSNSTLIGTSISNSNISKVNLSGAYISDTHMNSCVCNEASFQNAKIIDSELLDIDFNKSWFGGGLISRTLFKKCHGLETCRHYYLTSIDIDTISKSKLISPAFLVNCGLPEVFVEYLPSLLNKPIMYHSCFISYSSTDEEFAKKLYGDLFDRGVKVWFAPEDMKIGEKIWDSLDNAIQVNDKVVLILSSNSIDSDWVEDEVTKSFAEERKRGSPILFPIMIDDTAMSSSEPWVSKLRNQRNIGNFCGWNEGGSYNKSLNRLIRDLKKNA